MQLKQTLALATFGYWDGGKKDTFLWEIKNTQRDNKGEFCKIGSWEANHWFHVGKGKTEKLTLSYAKKHLKHSTKIPSTFEYVL